jgi:molecular chaperone DnaJ
LEFALQISFEESVQGIEREIAFETLMQCDTCKGSGAKEGSKVITCDECNGTGQVMKTARTIFGMMQQASLCPRCKGSGKVPEYPCASCHGEGRKKGKKTVTVRIPAGIMSGQSIKIRGEGQAGKRNAASGDLFIAITVLPDPRFERDGDDVRSTAHIPLTTAVLGGKMDIVTVQGNVTLAIPAGTQSHETFRIRGKGMPVLNTHRHGDHFVTVIVDIPTKLSKQEKRIFEELQGGHS